MKWIKNFKLFNCGSTLGCARDLDQALPRLEVEGEYVFVNSRGKRVSLTCPITTEPMQNPVIAADGFTYEKEAIKKWIAQATANGGRATSPITREVLENTTLTPDAHSKALLASLSKFDEASQEELTDLIAELRQTKAQQHGM